MLRWYAFPAYKKDVDDLTPVMRAAESGRIRVAILILQICPQSMEVRDGKGRTFLHLLKIMHLELVCEEFFAIPGVDRLRAAQDGDGNTPLHLALKTENFITAKFLMQKCLQSKTREELTIINNDGCSIFSLIAILRANKLDDKIVKLLKKKMPKYNTSSFLSSYGIRKAEIKESAGLLSVIAALLTMITFAAALQVPGGFDGDDGSPVLLKRVAFQFFLVSDE
ncbi:hypothetical protein BVRB_9g216120 [Beta vulgaris subsp. vulgaris]|nr:hypothetical protein BVRB_9g216120 [Beta vulgaris subsp. vulgaris]